MKRLLLCFLALTFPLLMAAQTVEEIKNNKEYLWGEGQGETLEGAERQAFKALVEKISVLVDENAELKTLVNTYFASLRAYTEKLVISQEPDAQVFLFIQKKDVQKVIDNRKNKVLDFVYMAQKAEEKRKIDDALRYYYWALCLLKSLPDAEKVTLPDQSNLLVSWIPQQIDEVLSNLKVIIVKEAEDLLTLQISYKGGPVSSFDYTFFDGRSYSNIYSATDGIGVIVLRPDCSLDQLKIQAEYVFLDQARLDKDLFEVMEVMKTFPVFRKAYIKVEKAEHRIIDSLPTTGTEAEFAPYEEIITQVLQAIKTNDYASVSGYFTPDGKEMFEKLFRYGNARIIGEPQPNYIKSGEEVFYRNIPVLFKFKNNNRFFVEKVNFIFNADRQIRSVVFGLGEANDILKHADYSERARFILSEFLETYKTAYALKRLDFLSKLFEDDFFVFTDDVGKKMKYLMENKDNKVHCKIEKFNGKSIANREFIRHLGRGFRSNEFINIRFADINVVHAPSCYGEVYGMELIQDYYSSNYGDSCHLFLYIDLNDPDLLVVKVCKWQWEKDPDFGWYHMGMF